MAQPTVRGYRGAIRDLPGLLARAQGVTLLRADRVYGRDHLLHAAALAARAVKDGRARSADVETETLLYAAGERQVQRAIAFLGLAPGTSAVAAVTFRPPELLDALALHERWTREDGVLEGDDGVLDAFGITAVERAMLPRERWGDLVLERVALLDVAKP